MQKYEAENKEKVKLTSIRYKLRDAKLHAIQLIFNADFRSPVFEKKPVDNTDERDWKTV